MLSVALRVNIDVRLDRRKKTKRLAATITRKSTPAEAETPTTSAVLDDEDSVWVGRLIPSEAVMGRTLTESGTESAETLVIPGSCDRVL
eukprot:CAMPEP_0196750920 /NCGR_PEP_ID=MMETSP1091-20130531/82067_1 /TAXON_ID=302021 /ORGANISM="Rhodomonas sp., Strain CCMP768" /LENGTH=88 /DNA_ID=CAMNT_0042098617 /DNA_START=92 /DNA_END=355 /DNA_ORIENTATION=-